MAGGTQVRRHRVLAGIRSCAVMGCKSATGMPDEQGEIISFFRFPFGNPKLRKRWEIFTKRADQRDRRHIWKATKSSAICHLHFISEAYQVHRDGAGKISSRRLLSLAPPPSLLSPSEGKIKPRKPPKTREWVPKPPPPPPLLPNCLPMEDDGHEIDAIDKETSAPAVREHVKFDFL